MNAALVTLVVALGRDRAHELCQLAAFESLVEAVMREVAVVAAGMTPFGELWQSSLRALFVDAALETLRNAGTDELVALARAGGESGGMYISHMRSEGDRLLEAVEELITIAREAGVAAEIYHLKAAGESNWGKLDAVIAAVEEAREEGLRITADMYNYPAGATGLDECSRQLGMSSRSLQRRLRTEGTTHKEILDRVRREMAMRYLSHEELTASQVAFLLGFSETAPFFRAFRRWTGSTPGEYRLSVSG